MFLQRNIKVRSRIIVAVVKQQVLLLIGLCVHPCACVSACMCAPGRVGVCMRIGSCNLVNPACNAYFPCCHDICGPSVSTIFFDIIS
jgi:hypothetical protein